MTAATAFSPSARLPLLHGMHARGDCDDALAAADRRAALLMRCRSISLDLERVRTVTVVGPRGAGKTTLLLQLLAQLRQAQPGRRRRMLALDEDQLGNLELLRGVAPLLGTDLMTPRGIMHVAAAPDTGRPAQLFIDLPSTATGTIRIVERISTIACFAPITTLLAVPLHMQATVVEQAVRLFRNSVTAAVLTCPMPHCDPSPALDVLAASNLPIAGISLGTELVGALELAAASAPGQWARRLGMALGPFLQAREAAHVA